MKKLGIMLAMMAAMSGGVGIGGRTIPVESEYKRKKCKSCRAFKCDCQKTSDPWNQACINYSKKR